MADLDIPSSLLDSFNTRQDQELRKLLNTTSDQTIADIKDNELLDLADLGDVDILSPTTSKEAIVYNASTMLFENRELDGADINFDDSGVFFTSADVQDAIEKTNERIQVTPEDFGAVGDGVTDDSAAIQAALNTGASVRFSAKRYFCASTLFVPTGAAIVGSGHSDWNFRPAGGGTWIISSASPAIQIGDSLGNFSSGVRLENFNLSKSGFTNGGAATGIGIYYRYGFYTSGKDLYIEGFDEGILIGDPSVAKGLGFTFSNTGIAGCTTCVHVRKGADVSFYGGRFGLNGVDTARGNAVQISGDTESVVFYRVIIANNSGFARNVYVTGASPSIYWVTFLECDMETATTAVFECDTTATAITIDGGWVGSPAPYLISNGARMLFTNLQLASQSALQRVFYVTGGNSIHIDKNQFIGSPQNFVEITNATNVNVTSNLMTGNAGVAVRITGSATASGGHRISNNYIDGISNNGILVSAGTGLKGVLVSNNHIRQFVNTGIRFIGTGPAKCNYTVDGNIVSTTLVSGTGRGIEFLTGAGLDYYMIVNNDTSDCILAPIVSVVGTNKVVANNLS